MLRRHDTFICSCCEMFFLSVFVVVVFIYIYQFRKVCCIVLLLKIHMKISEQNKKKEKERSKKEKNARGCWPRKMTVFRTTYLSMAQDYSSR